MKVATWVILDRYLSRFRPNWGVIEEYANDTYDVVYGFYPPIVP